METDLVIIGTGIAGLSALLAAHRSGRRILVVTKGRLWASGSTFVNRNGRWGMTLARSDREMDRLAALINRISQGTNVPRLSEIAVEESAQAYSRLKSCGVKFQRSGTTDLRVNPCYASFPGAVLIESTGQFAAALKKAIDWTNIDVLERATAVRLLVDDGACHGCLLKTADQEIEIQAKAVMLATGGAGACAAVTIVEPGLTGDGYRLLNEAGVDLVNMDYSQRIWQWAEKGETGYDFWRENFWNGRYKFFDFNGEAIEPAEPSEELKRARLTHAPIANLQPDRAIDAPFLDRVDPSSSGRDAGIRVHLSENGAELGTIFPSMQASNGGVVISAHGETGIRNLYAAGEVTTGMHGGDRVGGMMITSSLVFGRRAALHACGGKM